MVATVAYETLTLRNPLKVYEIRTMSAAMLLRWLLHLRRMLPKVIYFRIEYLAVWIEEAKIHGEYSGGSLPSTEKSASQAPSNLRE